MKHDLTTLEQAIKPIAEPYYSRAKELISLLERLPDENFDMKTWCAKYGLNVRRTRLVSYCPENECGTTCCIAGWVSHLAQSGLYSQGSETWNHQTDSPSLARTWLGLNTHQAGDLFLNYDATREDAVTCLRSYLATGQIRWE